jgi:uncharacterized heparinase superfamily protein
VNAALDHIAGFAARTPLSRTTLRREKGRGHVSFYLGLLSQRLREWGYSTKLYNHRLKGRHPVQLLGCPDDPAPGNATLGSAIFGGDMLHGTERVRITDRFWHDMRKASPEFQRYAHSFHWLQDLAQTNDQNKARDAAETIIGWWLPVGEKWNRDIWAAETSARRLINWLAHAPLILSNLDLVYRSRVLHAMAQQTRHLMRTWKDAPKGLPQVYTTTALTLAGLLLPGGAPWLAKGSKLLERTIKSFILPDGGPASRNASDAIRVMQLLIMVRSAYIETDSDLPPWVQITLDRVAPFVRTMRHGDGAFAHIGGVSAEGGFGTDAILAASEAKGKAIENAAHVGIQRLQQRSSCVIMDSGTPPTFRLSEKAHASTGSFEFSSGQDRIIVNMGPANASGPLAQLGGLCRATAAHSALVVSDRNSARLRPDGFVGRGVSETLTIRETLEDGVRISLMHDGYLKRFGVKHERALKLSKDGKRLLGSDKLFGPKLKKLEGETVLLRFHLHPHIDALLAPDGRVSLETRSGKIWIFDVDEGEASIEDSLYIAQPDSPSKTRQIVVRVPVGGNNTPICNWVLSEMET